MQRQPGLEIEREQEERGDVALLEDVELPKLYKVLLHNDDYTTMDFVVYILIKHFGKNQDEAHSIMLEVHECGAAVCGVYTYEVAETKVARVVQEAEQNGHPLTCSFEVE